MGERDAFLSAIAANPDDATPRLVFADWLDEHGEHKLAKCYRGVIKKFDVDFFSEGGALTLSVDEVSDLDVESGHHSRTHDDGWTISGDVHEDYFTWVNDFEAEHPDYGILFGNFESIVFASSEEAFQHFWKSHAPEAWDYWDI